MTGGIAGRAVEGPQMPRPSLSTIAPT